MSLFLDKEHNLYDIYNEKTLNIFSDASILKRKKTYLGCYGVVAVVGDTIIEKRYRIVSNTTVNNSEIKGIRAAISIALKYINDYDEINIFSDSQISVYNLTRYAYGWEYNPEDGLLYTSSHKPAMNQDIVIECIKLLSMSQGKINILHQLGHVDNRFENLVHARDSFIRFNDIKNSVDLNIIRYISTYNDFVDRNSRSILRRCDKSKIYEDPIFFTTDGVLKR